MLIIMKRKKKTPQQTNWVSVWMWKGGGGGAKVFTSEWFFLVEDLGWQFSLNNKFGLKLVNCGCLNSPHPMHVLSVCVSNGVFALRWLQHSIRVVRSVTLAVDGGFGGQGGVPGASLLLLLCCRRCCRGLDVLLLRCPCVPRYTTHHVEK